MKVNLEALKSLIISSLTSKSTTDVHFFNSPKATNLCTSFDKSSGNQFKVESQEYLKTSFDK